MALVPCSYLWQHPPCSTIEMQRFYCMPKQLLHLHHLPNAPFWGIVSIYELASHQYFLYYMDSVKRIWYLSPMRAAKVQASLRIRAVSPEPSLLAHTSSESRGTFRQKARSLPPLNGWARAVEICHDGMLEHTNSLVGAHIPSNFKSE